MKKKIVVLGGGLGSLSTVLHLTSMPNWQEQFAITIYQLGWRLGGKGASGRNLENNCRIEEHGLHIWMGWYENAFRMIRQAYEELGRPPDAPLATWDQAFQKHSYIVFNETVNAKWKNWPLDFPTTEETPGSGGEWPSIWSYIEMTIKGLLKLLEGSILTAPDHTDPARPHEIFGWVKYFFRHVIIWIKRIFRILLVEAELAGLAIGERILHEARKLAEEISRDLNKHHSGIDKEMLALLNGFNNWLRQRMEHELVKDDDEARRLFYVCDTAITCIIGVLSEGVGFEDHSLDKLDQHDWRDWLRKWGASEDTINSSLIRGFYGLLFAYQGGDPNRQRVATGVSIRFIFRMCFTYKGAIFWKMQAGMGDAIFAPIYDALKKRGVEIKFFHRVRELKLSADKKRIEKITLGRQAEPKNGDYQPLFDCKGLPCWPSAPLYDQLVEGEELRQQQINLESFWTPWQEREKIIPLENAKDFDIVLFGISLASIPYLCPELVAANPAWKAMVENLETVRTQAVQLWLKPNLQGLGGLSQSAVADAFPEPLDTWADMSHLIDRENWPPALMPENITYFCAPMPGGIPPVDERDAPAVEYEKVKAGAIAWLNQNAGQLWPHATSPNNPNGLNWELLIDPQNRPGEVRFDAQFWRANIDPSERYVLSLPNTTQFRLHATDRHFENLYITGDWIYTGVNAGCVEGTVISGMLASNAICGYPKIDDIIGYNGP
jgi:uncharacterized protein with NAD-binding domain and iron-sulfur cluster